MYCKTGQSFLVSMLFIGNKRIIYSQYVNLIEIIEKFVFTVLLLFSSNIENKIKLLYEVDDCLEQAKLDFVKVCHSFSQ